MHRIGVSHQRPLCAKINVTLVTPERRSSFTHFYKNKVLDFIKKKNFRAPSPTTPLLHFEQQFITDSISSAFVRVVREVRERDVHTRIC